jgi:hypothetical protein
MRYVVWGITGTIGVFMLIGGLIEQSVGWWIAGAVVFFGGFALGNYLEDPPTKRRL